MYDDALRDVLVLPNVGEMDITPTCAEVSKLLIQMSTGKAADHDAHQVGGQCLGSLQELKAADLGHLVVGNQHVVGARGQRRQRLLGVVRDERDAVREALKRL